MLVRRVREMLAQNLATLDEGLGGLEVMTYPAMAVIWSDVLSDE